MGLLKMDKFPRRATGQLLTFHQPGNGVFVVWLLAGYRLGLGDR